MMRMVMPSAVRHLLVVLMAGGLWTGCASTGELSPEEWAKLDVPLQRVLSGSPGGEPPCVPAFRPEGLPEYRVIVRGPAADLREAGVRNAAVLGDVVTVSLTIDEIRRVARIPSVRRIECGSGAVAQ